MYINASVYWKWLVGPYTITMKWSLGMKYDIDHWILDTGNTHKSYMEWVKLGQTGALAVL